MKKQFKYVVLLFCCNGFQVYGQNNLIDEIPYEPNELQSSGVERVGAVPLPTENFGVFPIPQINEIKETIRMGSGKKSKFESTNMPGRTLYMNGDNISSIRNQVLENVNVKIDQYGNIYIEAPQYEVASEQSYHPLLPKELPRFKKENVFEQMPIPQGTYSKDGGKAALVEEGSLRSAPEQPIMAKETIPELGTQPKIPPVNMDGVQRKDSDAKDKETPTAAK